MEVIARWMPLLAVAVALGLATVRARMLRRRLGHSAVTVFRSPSAAERLRVWLALAGLALLALSSVFPRISGSPGTVAPAWMSAAGLALVAASLVFAVIAIRALGESWRIGVDPEHPTELVSRGVYAHVRHPIYAAFVWCFLGLALLDPDFFHGLYAGGAWVVCRAQAIREERFLLERHGGAYAAYMARTWRFFPRLGREPAASEGA